MHIVDDSVIYDAHEFALAMRCEFALLTSLDRALGAAPEPASTDALAPRLEQLRAENTTLLLASVNDQLGEGELRLSPPPSGSTRVALESAQAATVALARARIPAIAHAHLFDGRLHTAPELLLLLPSGAAYTAVHSTLARSAKDSKMLTLGATADLMERAGIPLGPNVQLHLGTGYRTSHAVAALVPVVREYRRHVDALLDAHLAAGEPVRWGDRSIEACGRCAECAAALEPRRDVGLVWGLRTHHREALTDAGITTIDDLAASAGPVPRLHPDLLERLRVQAQLQLAQERDEASGVVQPVQARVRDVTALDALPAPDPGDIFFDFEGDPWWVDDDRGQWGLEYLFGVIESPGSPPTAIPARVDENAAITSAVGRHDLLREIGPPSDLPRYDGGRYVTFWAHDRVAERRALLDFLNYVARRRAAHPAMHIYHYAFYEPATLRRLARRHRVAVQEVEDLIEEGVFVDLYQAVRDGVHISQRSYSIKKLEPLYMGDQLRSGVTSGGDSVLAYMHASERREAGDEAGWRAQLTELAEYNAYDCLSTLRLRNWLLEQRHEYHAHRLAQAAAVAIAGLGAQVLEAEIAAAAPIEPAEAEQLARLRHEDVVAQRLDLAAGSLEPPDVPPGPEDSVAAGAVVEPDPALRLLAAAVRYHRNETEPARRAHRGRMNGSTTSRDIRDVLEVHTGSAAPWESTASGGSRRRIELVGRLGAGSTVQPGDRVCLLYEAPLPPGLRAKPGEILALTYGEVLARELDSLGQDRLQVRERIPNGQPRHTTLPTMVAPGPAPRTDQLTSAIVAVAEELLDEPSTRSALLDVLRRTPSRQRSGALPPLHRDSRAADLTTALLDCDDGYIAVQGPPGTGKTTLGAQVIAALATHGWRIGVVAQSHAVVEHMLDAVLDHGLAPERVGKRAGSGHRWRSLAGAAVAGFLGSPGVVLGGTTWDFANPDRVARAGLDLLVIEEAGQFSLAATIAVGASARRLLLLGDPRQLPQVSQGNHRAPVDSSALGWLARDGAIPADRGYVLGPSWRLHPRLGAAVAELSYSGELATAEGTADRHLDGVDPGVHVVDVPHRGNGVSSTQESAEAVSQVRALLGRAWTDRGHTRPLTESDVVVVAAYNAQVQQLRNDLDAAGLGGVEVGTVDRFQGREAVVVLLSLAASTARDAPRGLPFLLARERINVAISRGRWAAMIIRSPRLVRHMPQDREELADLAAFIRLTDAAHPRAPLTG